jgi:hypothetical protein
MQYTGHFEDHAFGLLVTPVPVYQNLLKVLRKYGATLRDLRFDAPTVADANISCTLLDLNTHIRFYVDRFEVLIAKMHEIGDDTAEMLVLVAWKALQASNLEIKLIRHGLTLEAHADLVKGTVEDVIKQYVTPPQNLADKVRSAVAFYLKGWDSNQEEGSIFLDRSTVRDEALYVKMSLVLSAHHVPIEQVRGRVDKLIVTALEDLGLGTERAIR